MRIGMILLTRFPPDIRVEKELSTLVSEHDVFLLCPRRGTDTAVETWRGMRIRRAFSRSERWWSHWQLMRTCRSSRWEREIERYVVDNRLDVLHVHDLPLLGTALAVAKRHNLPVVVDLHENYPEMLRESTKVPITKCATLGALVTRLSVSPEKWKAYERSTVPEADAVIVVIEEARDRLVRDGVPDAKVHVVPNYNSQKAQSGDSGSRAKREQNANKYRVVYAGGFGETRDLNTVVDAVALLDRTAIPGLEVIMVGGTARALTSLRQYAENKGVADRVAIHEWLPREEAEQLMDTSQIGLVPHVKSAHTDSTVPHKLFQYMVRRLPVIVSNCAPLERIVSASNCGMVYQSGDGQSLAECLRTIYENPEAARRMGDAGYSAVKEKYNWPQAGEKLLHIYRHLAARR